jgi:lactate dehydrogenase-like 2-hydroxyacid dehydrogenase
MSAAAMDILVLEPMMEGVGERLEAHFTCHWLPEEEEERREAVLSEVAARVRGIATFTAGVPASLMERLPALEIVSKIGVGYDNVDADWAAAHGVTVTNTPDVLTDEVADVTVGLLIATVRELPQAERYLRSGRWEAEGAFPLSPATLRGRSVGVVGMGRIGQAISRRLEGFDLPIVYHSRRPAEGVPYRHYPDLVEMARTVDTLIVIVPGGAGTLNLVDAEVLQALGPDGILINMARGSCVDERALIDALRDGKILSAGLDVFADEPHVPEELLAMEHVVLLPHIGSGSIATRAAMAQLMVDNLRSWAERGSALTPVPETPAVPPRDPDPLRMG